MIEFIMTEFIMTAWKQHWSLLRRKAQDVAEPLLRKRVFKSVFESASRGAFFFGLDTLVSPPGACVDTPVSRRVAVRARSAPYGPRSGGEMGVIVSQKTNFLYLVHKEKLLLLANT